MIIDDICKQNIKILSYLRNSFLQMVKTQILYKDGDKYEGQVNSQGKLQGYGKYTFRNGSYYLGQFKNNLFDGKGQLYDKQNNLTIIAIFNNNRANGQGQVIYFDQSHYKGLLKNNMRCGNGIYNFSSQSQFYDYQGQFQQDKFEGQGLLRYRQKQNYYRGYFVNGLYQGRGQLKQKEFVYRGDFYQGRIEGKGIITYKNGESYQGQFKFNKKNGKGKYTYNDNSYYQGQWKQDKRNGLGKLYLNQYQYFQGDFQNDEFSGNGKYFKKGEMIQGEFQNSKLNGQAVIKHFESNTITKGFFKNGLKNGFFEVQRQLKGQVIWFRGEFKNDTQNQFNRNFSSRI